MFFQAGKFPNCTFLLFLFLVFSVSAQKSEAERSTDAVAPVKSVLPEAQAGAETPRGGDSADSVNLPKNGQTADSSEENIDSTQKKIETPEQFDESLKVRTFDSTYRFRSNIERENEIKLETLLKNNQQTSPRRINSDSTDDPNNSPPGDGFQWRSAIQQSLLFLAVQHGYAFTQPKTREALKGKFFKDYAKSVKSLQGWDDGGRFFTNYVAHPLQGAFTGFIYVQNDPKAKRQQFGMAGDYWRSRLKALAWTTAWSTQFEIGPISQASIGNVGLKGKQTWEDIVVTPTLGTGMLITEDALDRFVMQRIERKTDNFYIRIFARMLLSPTRVFANMIRFKVPWYRDRPYAN